MLILQRGNQTSQRYPLDMPQVLIGRSAECDIVLDDRQVSRHHARVFRADDHYFIEDLGSKNGTHINGRDVTGVARLEDGDEIQIALRYKLAFVDAGATAPLLFEEAVTTQTMRLEPETRQVYIGGRVLAPPLSLAQYRLLELLIDAKGSVVARDDVARYVWPEDEETGVSEQAIDALVRRLRERLSELDPDYQYVITVRGHGFRFENRPS
jgi:DNA-binding winged helix-turn-helix (wHTH) protein